MDPLLTATVASEIKAWQEIRHRIPPDINAAIEQRLASWQKTPIARPVGVPAAPSALLVMRPGTIPRPLDSFFFEIINH